MRLTQLLAGAVLFVCAEAMAATVPRNLRIESTPPGAEVTVNGKGAGVTPASLEKYSISSEAGLTVEVSKDGYAPQKMTFTYEEAKDKSRSAPWPISFNLVEIRRRIPFQVTANITNAMVKINDKEVGPTPLNTTLIFERASGTAAWPELKLEILKEGYEYRTAESTPTNIFTQRITVDTAAQGSIAANSFLPARFVLTPVRNYDFEGGRTVAVRTDVHSAVNAGDTASAPVDVTQVPEEEPLVLSRISVATIEGKEYFAFSQPVREERAAGARAGGDESIVGANVWMRTGTAQTALTRLTEGRFFDLDPFLTADGKEVYYSSDRFGGRCICKQVIGRPALHKITASLDSLDSEPSVSREGGRLAYTSRSSKAPRGSAPMIWVANADGTGAAQICPGYSPSWSPDAKKLAFVSPKFDIWIMDADGGLQMQLTSGEGKDLYPIWTPPPGKHLVFASDSGKNEMQLPNFDIWIIGADGSGKNPLTRDGSFDSYPALGSGGTLLYFFSNRGGKRAGQESLQIYKMNMPQ